MFDGPLEKRIRMDSMKRAIYCGLISAVAGFVLPMWIDSSAPSIGQHWIIGLVICPAQVLGFLIPTADVPARSFAFFNAFIYGAAGFTLWLLIMGDDDSYEKPDENKRDRTFDL